MPYPSSVPAVQIIDRIPLVELRNIQIPTFRPEYFGQLHQAVFAQPHNLDVSHLPGCFTPIFRGQKAVAVDYGFINVITTVDNQGFWATQLNIRPFNWVKTELNQAMHQLKTLYHANGGNTKLPYQAAELWKIFLDLPEAHPALERVASLQDQRRHMRNQMIEVHVQWLLKYDQIFMEDLNLERFKKDPKKWMGVEDAGWLESRALVHQEAKRNGVEVLEIPSHFSSSTCPVCGNSHWKNRIQGSQDFRCKACGFYHHADAVACINLLRRGGQMQLNRA